MLITNPHRLKNKTLSSEQFRCDLIYVISYCIYYTHNTIYYLLGHFNRIYGYRNYSAKSCLQLKHQSHYKAVLSFIFIIRFILITIILNIRGTRFALLPAELGVRVRVCLYVNLCGGCGIANTWTWPQAHTLESFIASFLYFLIFSDCMFAICKSRPSVVVIIFGFYCAITSANGVDFIHS